jgi:hypothetical protein
MNADISVPGDGYMSGRHFAVEHTGAALFVHDLGSSNGTFVNGKQVDRAPAASQDLIAAGCSRFRVSFEPEEAVPNGPRLQMAQTIRIPRPVFGQPQASEESGNMLRLNPSQRLMLDALYRSSGNVFAYLDAGRDPLIPAFVQASGEQFAAVLQSPAGRRGPAVSTLVVTLARDSRLHQVLFNEGWEGKWGVYCASPAPLSTVAEHLRSIVTLQTRGGMPFNLPLSDPQFLQSFLGRLAPAEAATLFGPIQHFFSRTDSGDSLLRCACADEGVSMGKMILQSALAG